MTARSTNAPPAPHAARFALTAGLALLAMAVLAPLAHFGVLQTLIVPADAAATVESITASEGPFPLSRPRSHMSR